MVALLHFAPDIELPIEIIAEGPDRRITDIDTLNTELAAWQHARHQHRPAPGPVAIHHHRRPDQTPPPIPKQLEATVY